MAKRLLPTDSASPAGDAERPVGVPGAELSHSALNKSQGHCQTIVRSIINNVLVPGTVSTCPILNGEAQGNLPALTHCMLSWSFPCFLCWSCRSERYITKWPGRMYGYV